MLLQQRYLYTPGPTPVPDRVKHAMNAPMIGHRSDQFPSLLTDVANRLQTVFGSKSPVLLIAGTGTAALETAAANVIHEGDNVIVIVTGAFGERFASICETFGARVHRLQIEWGKSCSAEQLEDYIRQNDLSFSAVFATYCETSTGVLNPIQDLARIAKEKTNALFIVDGVSCIGAVPVDMEGWGIDLLVSGSQKALMLPPGLAFIALSSQARSAIQRNTSKRFYLDLNKYINSFESESSTPFTPALSLIYGAREVCSMIEEEGFEQVISRHQVLKEMTRAGLKALHLPLLASDEDASPTITAVIPGEGEAAAIKQHMQAAFHIELAEGQGKLKNRIFRMGHMGYSTPFDILKALSALEMTVRHISGRDDALGMAVKRAEEVWMQHV